MTGERDLRRLLGTMEPELRAGVWVFTSVKGPAPEGFDIAVTVAEAEGTTLVLPQEQADAAGFSYDFRAAWIILRVHSALDAVGLTAAVATHLADFGLSCNVVAGFYHDHIFVPHDEADAAMSVLKALSAQHRL
ncbi:ACT domain-containing protein [Streptodolium elevatio]|uniref:ACT domain-containing protein n=1 Tax=Streptodolium elevatio TaxID=3157996 RepID=A0ABV3DN95_9ACTN